MSNMCFLWCEWTETMESRHHHRYSFLVYIFYVFIYIQLKFFKHECCILYWLRKYRLKGGNYSTQYLTESGWQTPNGNQVKLMSDNPSLSSLENSIHLMLLSDTKHHCWVSCLLKKPQSKGYCWPPGSAQ